MDVVACIEKTSGGDGDVGDGMTVEGKLKRQLHRHCSSMRFRKKFVYSEISASSVNAFAMEIREVFILNDGAVVIIMEILVAQSDVVLLECLISLLFVDIEFLPIKIRSTLGDS